MMTTLPSLGMRGTYQSCREERPGERPSIGIQIILGTNSICHPKLVLK